MSSPSSSLALSGIKATIELEELEAEETGVEEIEVEDNEAELWDSTGAAWDAGSEAGSKATIEFEQLGVEETGLEETGLEEIEAKETEVEVPACGNAAEDFKRYPIRNETKTFFMIEGGLA